MTTLATLANDVSLSAAAAQAGVSLNYSPFLPYRNVLGFLSVAGATGSWTILIQTAPDNATWTTAATLTGTGQIPSQHFEVQTDLYIRANVSVAGTAGTFTCQLIPTSFA